MYQFVTGPLAWFAFSVFFIGLIVRIVFYIRGLDGSGARKSQISRLNDLIKMTSRSILGWFFPFALKSQRNHLGFSILVCVFRVGLLFTPIFLLAHNILLKERWGLRLWTLRESTSDIFTIAVIVSAVFLILRSIALPEIRTTTGPYDYVLIAIIVSPFITGFLAYHQFPIYRFWLIAHILSGEFLLIAIPFTKLSRLG